MFSLTEFRALVVLISMLTLPGWALLSLSDTWRRWKVLQRWTVAVGLSIAFYPVLFYGVRSVLPFLTLGPYKMSAILLICAAVTGWQMRKHWKEQFELERLEWIAIAIFGMTLFTRFWIIRDQPYPAWSDSLHHAILTRLTAVQGQLPRTMEPYFPIPLAQYHLGLYSLSATTQWLAQVPAHTALLWMAQTLNGLCGLGVYLVLDRKVGRVGALVGTMTVGLLSHQPAFYVNWGRFTQLSSQTILLIAWLVTWEALATWKLAWREHRVRILWSTALAALLTGAVFLLHFRVAIFYLLLLIASVPWMLWRAHREQQVKSLVLGLAVVAVVALIVVAPVLGDATREFVRSRWNVANQTTVTPSELSETIQGYYEFPWSSVPELAAHMWLIVLAGLSTVLGLVRRNRLVLLSLVWVALLYVLASAYTLGIPLLSFTNLGAVLIMLYLPIGLTVGCATEDLLTLCPQSRRERIIQLVIALTLIAGFVASHARAVDIKPFRYFVTSADVEAMHWIEENTPPDALFAVNTYFWLPRTPHGTDAGYWIPYFTGRQTTAGTMLIGLPEQAYVDQVVELSRAVEKLEVDNVGLRDLQAMGVDYVYVGSKGDFSGPGLDADRLSRAKEADFAYRSGGVSILKLSPSPE